jgi:hypothetical protein
MIPINRSYLIPQKISHFRKRKILMHKKSRIARFSLNLLKFSAVFCITYHNALNTTQVCASSDTEASSRTPFVTTIKHIQKNGQKKFNIEQSAVILCNDLEDIDEFSKKVQLSNKYPKKLKFLVICEKSIDRNFPKPHKLYWKEGSIIEFEYFLINKAGKLELSTYEWFLEGKCNEPQMTPLNLFSKSSFKWENDLQIEDKFKDFNQCSIILSILASVNSSSFCIKNNEVHHYQLDLFKALSTKSNFRRKFEYLDLSVLFNMQIMKIIPIINYQLKLNEGSFFVNFMSHLTTTHTELILKFAIPSAEPYTSYEKLLMPFDELTWIFLIATFGFSFGFIFSIKKCAPTWIQNAFFGEGVQTPAFNLLAMFFGIGQIRVPIGNSARIIMMTFIYFCLVIRTAYQGVFFEMMTHELRKPQPQSIDDLFEWNYSIYSPVTNFAFYLHSIDKARR